LRIVDNLTRNSWQVPGTPEDVRWSAAAYISHDDLIALEAAPAVPGEMMVCDIEVSLVFPGNRLAGRYQEGT
jgi:hypothetical protein